MSIAFDAAGDTQGTGVTSLTTAAFAITGTNRCLRADVGRSAGSPPAVTAVKWGGSTGDALTAVPSGDHTGQSFFRISAYYLTAPAAASRTLYCSFAATADECALGGANYTGVDQTTPLGAAATADGSSAAPTVDVSSATNDVVTGAAYCFSTPISALGAGQTEAWREEGIAGALSLIASYEAGATTVTHSYTLGGNAEWVIVAVPLKPAAAGQNLSPGGIASSGVYGSHTIVDINPTASLTGVASAALYGSHTLANVAARTLGPVGNLGSAAVYGTHILAITSLQLIQATGLASSAVLGAHTLANVAARTLSPGGIASAAVFGSHTIAKQAISQGVPSAAVYGSFQIAASGTTLIAPAGKASAAVYGAHTLANVAARALAPSGKASAATYGAHTVAASTTQVIAPGGIASAAVLGATQVVQPINRTIAPPGILSGAVYGAHYIKGAVVPDFNPRRCRRTRR